MLGIGTQLPFIISHKWEIVSIQKEEKKKRKTKRLDTTSQPLALNQLEKCLTSKILVIRAVQQYHVNMSLDRIKLNVNVAIIDVIKEPVTTNHLLHFIHPDIHMYTFRICAFYEKH